MGDETQDQSVEQTSNVMPVEESSAYRVTEPETQPETQTEPASEPATEPAPEPAAQPAEPDKATQAIEKLAATLAQQQQVIQQNQQQAKPQYTQEQLNDMLKVYRVQQEKVAQAFGLEPEAAEPVAKLLQEMAEGVVRQALTGANVYVQNLQQQHLTPMQQYIEESQRQQREQEFMKSNPDIASHPNGPNAARMVYKHLYDTGTLGTTVEEAYKNIAQKTREIIGIQQGQGTPQQTQQVQNAPKMSTVATGGRSGTGQPSTTKSNEVKDLWAGFSGQGM